MGSSVIQAENAAPYRGPPIDHCPYCLFIGRGMVSLIPVMTGVDEVTWLCQNWQVCLFPRIYGPEAVQRSVVPRRSVNPALLGYVALENGDNRGGQRRVFNVMEDDNLLPARFDVAPIPSPPSGPQQRPPSIISHSTTSSDGSDHDLTQLMPSFRAAPPAIATTPLSVPRSAVSEVTYTTLMPQVKTTVTPVSTPNVAPVQDSFEQLSSSASEFQSPTSDPVLSTSTVPTPPPIVPLVLPPPKPAPQPSAYASIAFGKKKTVLPSTSASTPANTTPTAPTIAYQPRKRPLTTLVTDKQSFPAYGSNGDAGSSTSGSAAASKSNATTAAVMSLVAKRLAKVRKVL